MIKTETIVPHIYYKESRDFQLFGRLYDIIFNYIKTNVDLMENFPINTHTDSKLIELLCRTLGFENKTDYRVDDLNAVCNIFIDLIKNKGTTAAIEKLSKTILNIENIKDKASIVVNDIKILNGKSVDIKHIDIFIPEMSSNPELKLFEDILNYIIPAGVIYTIHDVATSNNDKSYLQLNENYRLDIINPNSPANNNQINRSNNSIIKTTNITAEGSIELSRKVGDMRYSTVAGSSNKNKGDE